MKIENEAAVARFKEKIPKLIEEKVLEMARVGEVSALGEVFGIRVEGGVNIEKNYSEEKEKRDTQAVENFTRTDLFEYIMNLK